MRWALAPVVQGRAGGRAGGRAVLVEAGPWGEAWQRWREQAGRKDTGERLRAWCDRDPRELWQELRAAPVPADPEERVATWAVLQFWSFGRKPVYSDGARWRTHGFNAAEAYRQRYALEARAGGRLDYDIGPDRRLPDVVRALSALPDLSRLEVHHGDARELAPIPGAHVYIDPDYEGTTGYGFTLPRLELLTLAERWRAAGAEVVAVSEAAPLPLAGWHHHRLPPAPGRGRTWSAQQAEWLTMSRAPTVRQGELFGVG